MLGGAERFWARQAPWPGEKALSVVIALTGQARAAMAAAGADEWRAARPAPRRESGVAGGAA